MMELETDDRTRASTKIWISHVHKDKTFVETLRQKLAIAGFNVILGEDILSPGESVLEATARAIADSDIFLVVISKSSSESLYLEGEVAFAFSSEFQQNKPLIIPLIIEKGSSILTPLTNVVAIDFTESEKFESSYSHLLNTLQHFIETDAKTTQDKEKSLEISIDFLRSQKQALDFRSLELDQQKFSNQKHLYSFILALSMAIALLGIYTIILLSSGRAGYEIPQDLLVFILGIVSGAGALYWLKIEQGDQDE
jgi:hypothetical protein